MLIRLIKELFAASPKPPAPAPDTDCQAALDTAFALQQAGRLDEAAEAYAALAETADEPATFACLLTELQVGRGRAAEVITTIKAAYAKAPGDARVCAALASALYALGEAAEGLDRADEALRLEPALAPALLWRGRCLEALGRTEGATMAFAQLARAGRPLQLARQAAVAWTKLEPASEAAAVAEIRLLAADGYTLDAMARYQARRGEFAESAPLAEAGGDVANVLGRWEEALEAFTAAVARRPERSILRAKLAEVLGKLGEYERALELFDECVACSPALAQAHLGRGRLRFETGDLAGALEDFRWAHAVVRGLPWNGRFMERFRAAGVPPTLLGGEFKFRHDAEQVEYLVERERLPEEALELVDELDELAVQAGPHLRYRPVRDFCDVAPESVRRTYNQPLYIPPADMPERSPLSDELNFEAIERAYLSAKPELTYFDGLLTDDALTELRAFCLEATIWNNPKDGYLGAYLHDGFCSPLLLRIAHDLRVACPKVFGGLPLSMMWGYKYDSRRQGIGLHADQALVNLNFWLTPDDCNLDETSGGLVVYPWEPPPGWDSVRYNQRTGEVMHRLQTAGVQPEVVPHRANRAVVFNSKLFHHTDDFAFRTEYTSRRLNVTMLFGYESR